MRTLGHRLGLVLLEVLKVYTFGVGRLLVSRGFASVISCMFATVTNLVSRRTVVLIELGQIFGVSRGHLIVG